MSINRIDISIEDNKRFGLTAFLVDRPDFLADIQWARDLINIKKIPYSFNTFSYEEANNVVNYYNKGICNIFAVYSVFKDLANEKHLNVATLDNSLASAFLGAESIASKYKKSYTYIPLILAAILVNNIQEADILPTNTLELDKETLKVLEDDLENSTPRIAIVVDSMSTRKEIIDVFDYIQKYKFRSKKVTPDDYLYRVFKQRFANGPLDILPDTFQNIKTTRDWYWRNKKGESALNIAILNNKGRVYYNKAKSEIKKGDYAVKKYKVYRNYLQMVETESKKIEKAIVRYKKILTRHLASS